MSTCPHCGKPLVARARSGLKPSQSKLLAFIEAAERDGSEAPSLQEMATHLGLASRSAAHRMIGQLEERGYVRRLPRRHRALEIVGPGA